MTYWYEFGSYRSIDTVQFVIDLLQTAIYYPRYTVRLGITWGKYFLAGKFDNRHKSEAKEKPATLI